MTRFSSVHNVIMWLNFNSFTAAKRKIFLLFYCWEFLHFRQILKLEDNPFSAAI